MALSPAAGALEAPRRIPPVASAKSAPPRVLVWFMVVFLAMEYLRPPALQPLRLQAIFLVVILVSWLSSRDRPWSRTLTLQTAFLLAGILMMPFAHNYYVVYLNARFMFGFLTTALATVWLLAYRSHFKQIIWSWVAIMLFQSLWGLTHDGMGYGSFLGDENDLALACGMAFPFVFLGTQFLTGSARWICVAVALVIVAGIVASFSRSGFLGLASALVYCVMSGRHRVRNITLGAAAAGIFFLATPSDYKDELGTISETSTGTAETRFFLWAAAAKMWMDRPILGVGPMNARFLIGQYQPDPTKGGMFSAKEFVDRSWGMTALHSVYLQLLSERGAVGVVIFSWIALLHFSTLRRLRRDVARRAKSIDPSLARDTAFYALALEASLVAFLVAGAFLNMLYFPFFWFFTALGVAFDRAVRRELAIPAGPGSQAPAPEPTEESSARVEDASRLSDILGPGSILRGERS